MAQDQQDGKIRGNRGDSQRGAPQRPKSPPKPKCPICTTRDLPKGRQACFECKPDIRLTVFLSEGKECWQILVQTYRNGAQVNVPFKWQVSGENLKTVEADTEGFNKGVFVINLPFAESKRTATFHVIGTEADTDKLQIKAHVDYRGPGVDKNESILENLLRGLTGKTRQERSQS